MIQKKCCEYINNHTSVLPVFWRCCSHRYPFRTAFSGHPHIFARMVTLSWIRFSHSQHVLRLVRKNVRTGYDINRWNKQSKTDHLGQTNFDWKIFTKRKSISFIILHPKKKVHETWHGAKKQIKAREWI